MEVLDGQVAVKSRDHFGRTQKLIPQGKFATTTTPNNNVIAHYSYKIVVLMMWWIYQNRIWPQKIANNNITTFINTQQEGHTKMSRQIIYLFNTTKKCFFRGQKKMWPKYVGVYILYRTPNNSDIDKID